MIATIAVQSEQTRMQDHRHMFSLTANAAGAPLPLIPRRSQSHVIQSSTWPLSHSNPSLSASSSRATSCVVEEPSIVASASIVTITPATPPKTETDSDNASLHRGKKRKKDLRVPNPSSLYPPEFSTPVSTRRSPSPPRLSLTPISKNSVLINENPATRAPLIYTPGIPIRLSMESLGKSSHRDVSAVGLSLHSVQPLRPSSSASSDSLSSSSSLSSISKASTGGSQASQTNTPLIRKKSGQVVRPSLKSSSSYTTSFNFGITSPDLSLPPSKSEPVTPFRLTTPTISKAVHFDENLERVKLFLTEQKPLAVSREGSPGDTDEETSASGNENNEIARFFGRLSLVGDSNKKPNSVDPVGSPFGTVVRSATKLLMHNNIPSRSLSLSSSSADAILESLVLAKGDKSIQGSVLVRNIAFDKSVAARFSFDGWCTTSEVNARWMEGVGATREGQTEWDRFQFTIWLGDLKLGEEKGDSRKLELAVRYRVASKGYEHWDNNGGRNYVATFERSGLLEERARGRRTRLKKKSPTVPFSDDELSDLLEKVAATSKTTRKARSISPTVSTPKWVPMSLECSPSSPTQPSPIHTRTRSFPFSSASSPKPSEPAYGWMEKSPPSPQLPDWLSKREKPTFIAPPTNLGSPRDLADDTFPRFKFPTIPVNDSDESVDGPIPVGRNMRRHQRGGYFDEQLIVPLESTISGHGLGPAEQTTPTPPPSSRFHSFPPLGLALRDSTRENRQPLSTPVTVLPMDAPQAISISTQSSASFVGQIRNLTPSTLPLAVESPQSPDDTSDSSSTSTLLDNASPPSSRSSTPPSEEDIGIVINRKYDSDDLELYREFLNRFCFFTGPGSLSSASKSRLDEVKNKISMNNESSSESATPTLTPSGSI